MPTGECVGAQSLAGRLCFSVIFLADNLGLSAKMYFRSLVLKLRHLITRSPAH
jgi:hypothetical protein